MKRTKIVVIGAGSASFGLTNLGAILRTPELQGSELCLVDIDPAGLQLIARLAERLNKEWQADFIIKSSTARRDCLSEADFVILSVAMDREKCWRMDQQIAQKYRIMHYAENGGPGGFMHLARNVALIMPILKDIERMCPEAWVLNFTNPVPRICIAAARFTKVKMIGICHQLEFGYLIAGNVLSAELGIAVAPDYQFRWEEIFGEKNQSAAIKRAAAAKLDILAAGLNHFTWMLSIRDKQTGTDLYPLLRERFRTHYPGFEPLTRVLFDSFKICPVPGDCHLVEYLPYTHNMARNSWAKYEIQMYPLDKGEVSRHEMWQRITAMAEGREPLDVLREVHTERAELVIAAIKDNQHAYEPALNIPNRGYIANLPEGAIVEVPAVVSAAGVHGIGVGALPVPIAELCRRQITLAELSAVAAVTGDRELALQAFLLDPMIDDPEVAQQLLHEYLVAEQDYLPQFSMNSPTSSNA